MKKYVPAKRADKLINGLIDYLSELKKMPELIQMLINCGFTYNELVKIYSFDPSEIAESFKRVYTYSVDDDNELYIYENGYLLATVCGVTPSKAQNMLEEIVFDKRGIDLAEIFGKCKKEESSNDKSGD